MFRTRRPRFSKSDQITFQHFMLYYRVTSDNVNNLFPHWNFLLFLSLKTIQNSNGQMRQLYAYVANQSTRRLVENGMSTGLTNTHTARGFSVLYHVFPRKQSILCSALRHKSYLTLPYVTSLRDSFCLGTFAHGFFGLPPRSLASS